MVQVSAEERRQNKGENRHHRTTQSSVPREQLHFINNADPVSVKTAASKKVVGSYTARATHRKIRQDRLIDFQKSKHAENRSETTSKASHPQVNERESAIGRSSKRYIAALNMPTAPAHRIAGPTYVPSDVWSSGYGDPFQSFAIQLNPFEQCLLDHCR